MFTFWESRAILAIPGHLLSQKLVRRGRFDGTSRRIHEWERCPIPCRASGPRAPQTRADGMSRRDGVLDRRLRRISRRIGCVRAESRCEYPPPEQSARRSVHDLHQQCWKRCGIRSDHDRALRDGGSSAGDYSEQRLELKSALRWRPDPICDVHESGTASTGKWRRHFRLLQHYHRLHRWKSGKSADELRPGRQCARQRTRKQLCGSIRWSGDSSRS